MKDIKTWIGIVIITAGCVYGAGMLNANVENNTCGIQQLRALYKDNLAVIMRIDRRLSRIEGKLNIN